MQPIFLFVSCICPYRAALYATAHQTTLNRVVESALEHYVPAY